MMAKNDALRDIKMRAKMSNKKDQRRWSKDDCLCCAQVVIWRWKDKQIHARAHGGRLP
jgi:hypothetical protein